MKYNHQIEVEETIGNFDTTQKYNHEFLTLHQQKYLMK